MAEKHPMEARIAAKMGKMKRRPIEDMPGWKWWKQGNQKAGYRYAVKNPPPSDWSVHLGKSNRVQAGEPQPDAVPGSYSWKRGSATTLKGNRPTRSGQIRGLKRGT